MAYEPFQRFGSAGRAIDQAQYDEGLRRYMLRVYNYMTLGLGITGAVALLTASSPALMAAIFGTPLKWVVMLAPLGFVFFLSLRIDRMSAAKAQTVFWIYAAVMGLSMAAIFLVFTGTSIARVFFITSAMFAGTSLLGYTTKRDLTNMGGFMMMGLIGILVAGLVNLFLQSSALHFAISVIGVIVFTGLTAWDTQRIKEVYDENHGHEITSKLAIMGALTLYLDFINMFTSLLHLFGDRSE